MTITTNPQQWNQTTPPVTYPLDSIANLTALGRSLLMALDPAQARSLIQTDSETTPRPPQSHGHDTTYYPKATIDAALLLKANIPHNHDIAYYTKAEIDALVSNQRRKVIAFQAIGTTLGQAVITNDDKILVWGIANNATLSQTETATGIPQPLKTNGNKTGTWSKVVATRYNIFAITTTGELWGMGENANGQLALGDITNTSTRQHYLHRITVASKSVANIFISLGDTINISIYAICADGTLYSWGYNGYGQLGINNTTTASTPQFIVIPAGATTAVDLSAANAPLTHVILRTADNKIHTWGYNGYGQLGLADTTNRLQPVTVTGKLATEIQAVGGFDGTSTYYAYTQIILTSGALQTTGGNPYGAIGDNSTNQRTSFTNTSLNHTNLARLVKSPSANFTSGYITTNGIIWLSGYNGYGQVGNGTTTATNVFTQPAGAFQGVVLKAILTGGQSGVVTTALLTTIAAGGQVWATGYNGTGQAGDGSLTARTTFAQVPLPEPIIDLSSVAAETLNATAFFALGLSGRIYSWGHNGYAQLGQGHLAASYVPNEVYI